MSTNQGNAFDEATRETGEVSLDTVIRNAWRGLMEGTHTAIPGRIVGYDPTTRLCSVQPTLMVKFIRDTQATPIDAIPGVPVAFMGVPGACILVPDNLITEGLECLLIVCERSIDLWYANGGIIDPQDERMFDFTDSVAFLGFSSQPNIPVRNGAPTSLEIQYGTTWIEMTQGGTFKIKNNFSNLTSILTQIANALPGGAGVPIVIEINLLFS